ncbi:MAG: acetyltransferase [Chlorobium sp.]|nr:MAG: acetyltransferase [Chlorobium sp.]
MAIEKLAIIGASGHGKVVADAALCSGWDEVIFFDDAWPELSKVGIWKVIGNTRKLLEQGENIGKVVVAIGNNAIRLEKQQSLQIANIPLATIIHPSAIISPFSEIGSGSVVFAGAVINPFAQIGSGCIINTGSSIDHDCWIADGVHISPGAHLGGNVHVGRATWLGIGTSVKHGIHIGENVIVGAGAAVVNDIASGLTVVGVPAREITIKIHA